MTLQVIWYDIKKKIEMKIFLYVIVEYLKNLTLNFEKKKILNYIPDLFDYFIIYIHVFMYFNRFSK